MSIPNVECFHSADYPEYTDEEGRPLEEGWYWWSCCPGCLPDSEPIGPFPSEEAAEADYSEGIEV